MINEAKYSCIMTCEFCGIKIVQIVRKRIVDNRNGKN